MIQDLVKNNYVNKKDMTCFYSRKIGEKNFGVVKAMIQKEKG